MINQTNGIVIVRRDDGTTKPPETAETLEDLNDEGNYETSRTAVAVAAFIIATCVGVGVWLIGLVLKWIYA